MYNPIQIANFFILKAKEENIKVGHLKLQKLLYYAYGWYLAVKGSAQSQLFSEPIQAWKYGPVVPSIYHECKSYGDEIITEPLKKKPHFANIYGYTEVDPPTDAEDVEFLEKVWRTYKNFTGFQLSDATHSEGSPWHIATEGGTKVRFGQDIDDNLIYDYFRERLS
ncbi:MAG: SocA family protein [Bacteroidetes bacterium]|nr:SocA family protein [Bacteroidota bacterium]